MNAKQQFLNNVWPRVMEFFDRFGSANYDGYLEGGLGWYGPYVWGENGDVVRVITRFCEDEFGFLNVHNESKVDTFRFENFEKGERWKSIDIDVTDASGCESSEAFRRLMHTLFIEVKHAPKASVFIWDVKKKIEWFEEDCHKLQEQIDKGRCKYAIVILIDDGDGNGKPYVADANAFMSELKAKYPGVEPFIWQKKRR